MASDFDIDREVAEKVVKRAMTPIREIIQRGVDEKWTDEETMGLKLGVAKEIDRDLGILGLALANRYNERVEYQTALGVMSAENVRLRGAVEVISEMYEKSKQQAESLAGALAKAQTVAEKLKHLHIAPVEEEEKSGFHSPKMV